MILLLNLIDLSIITFIMTTIMGIWLFIELGVPRIRQRWQQYKDEKEAEEIVRRELEAMGQKVEKRPTMERKTKKRPTTDDGTINVQL